VSGFTLSARIGTTIPIGGTVPNPFLLGDMGIEHEHVQFGTGTFVPILGVEAYRRFGGVTVDTYFLTLQSLYENGYGYRAGNRYAFGVGAASDLGTKRWRFRATLDYASESAESWSGIVYTDEGNIGRTDVLAGLEATYRIGDDWHASIAAKVPVYTHVIGGQIDTPAYAQLTIGTHVHVWNPKHVHPAVAALGADWSGLDERELSTDGSATALVSEPGKVTVVDFWADWCKPCGELDHMLADVARRHPDALAVRKVNVVDADTPAWNKYLAPGNFNLPHVKLYDRDGKLVWERSASPVVLAAAVEDAVGGANEPTEPVAPASVPRIAITVTDDGFRPERVTIPRAHPVVLVFTRRSETTCAVDVHFMLPNGTKIDRRLPLNRPVEIPVQIDRGGEIPYACGMDMVHGAFVVK
jgi:thiol-disulfide isomerase/thioredoxin